MKALTWSFFLFVSLFALPALAQEDDGSENELKYGSTAEQRQNCLEQLTIYRSFRDQNNLHSAYVNWKKACEVCPPDASERIYADGAKFIKAELKEAQKVKDSDRMKVLTDSLMLVYDLRILHFASTDKNPNNGCMVEGLMAADIYSLQKKTRLKDAFNLYKKSVDCLKEKSLASVISGYYIAMNDLYKETEDAGEKKQYIQGLITEYLSLQNYCETAIKSAKDEKKKEDYTKAKNNIDEIFVRVSQCSDMIPVLEEKLEENPEDLELRKKALRLMNAKDCTENSIYLPTAEYVHAQEPSAPSAYAIGQSYAKRNELSKSLKYFEESVNLCPDCPERETYLLKTGQVASALKITSKARSYANKVLEMNPGSGDAYLLIGDVIASSSASCEDGKLGARSVYWLAADYYIKAKRVDASISEKADKKIASAASQYPSREDLFSFGKKEGDSFTVPCFGEETTIRERK